MLRFHIPNMTCGCAKSVTKALLSVDPQAGIKTDPSAREVRVDSALDESVFLAVLNEAGYPVKQVAGRAPFCLSDQALPEFP